MGSFSKETRLFFRLLLIGIGIAAICLGLFAPEREQAAASVWFLAP